MRFLAHFCRCRDIRDPLIRELVGATRDAKALHALFADSAPSSAQHRSNFNEKIVLGRSFRRYRTIQAAYVSSSAKARSPLGSVFSRQKIAKAASFRPLGPW